MTLASTLDIHLLLTRHDDQTPVMEQALDGCSTSSEPRPAMPSKRPRDDDEASLDDLQKQKWGVVVPPGETGERLLELVEPLIARRRQQQGSYVRVFRSPPMSASDLSLLDAFRMRDRWRDGQSSSAEALPYYLLIVGDLQQVPLAVQRALSVSTNHAVGRLSFERDDDYRAYVAKLIAQETGAKSPRGDILLHTVQDGTRATEEGHANLIQRLVGDAKELSPRPSMRESGTRIPTPRELFEAVEQPSAPTVLCTLAHGEGAPRGGWPSAAEQLASQGSLGFGFGRRITGRDIAERPFLPGGVWIAHSSFSAGTPPWSSYLGWLEKLAESEHSEAIAEILASRPLSEEPFVSSISRAALANPKGPLAFIGHVDLAWSYAFPEPTSASGSRTASMIRMMSGLAQGKRVGLAMRGLFEYLVQVNEYLVALYNGPGDPDSPLVQRERALWWMVREELAGYILLGDPAARMAVAPAPPPLPRKRRASTEAELQALDRRKRLERAVAEHILGQPGQIALARHDLAMGEEQFDELAAAYRAAGMAAISRLDED